MEPKPVNSNNCPCGSGRPLSECCEPLIDHHAEAESAEALMRSRYTAYTLGRSDYLLESWHPATRPTQLDLDYATPPEWLGLTILHTDKGGVDNDGGVVEFTARLKIDGQLETMHEVSRFIRHQGRWHYLDGDVEGENTTKQPGRNAPCPCGSGKKYKRCCGAAK